MSEDRQPEVGPPQADAPPTDHGSNGKSEGQELGKKEEIPLSGKDQFGMKADVGPMQIKATGLVGGAVALVVAAFLCSRWLSPTSDPADFAFCLLLAVVFGWIVNESANRKVIVLLSQEKENYRLEVGRLSEDKRKLEVLILKNRRSSIPPPTSSKQSTTKPPTKRDKR